MTKAGNQYVSGTNCGNWFAMVAWISASRATTLDSVGLLVDARPVHQHHDTDQEHDGDRSLQRSGRLREGQWSRRDRREHDEDGSDVQVADRLASQVDAAGVEQADPPHDERRSPRKDVRRRDEALLQPISEVQREGDGEHDPERQDAEGERGERVHDALEPFAQHFGGAEPVARGAALCPRRRSATTAATRPTAPR